jgi:hypothetical protein
VPKPAAVLAPVLAEISLLRLERFNESVAARGEVFAAKLAPEQAGRNWQMNGARSKARYTGILQIPVEGSDGQNT